MYVYEKSLVDIPDDKGIHIKSADSKGEKYVYKYVKYFRNSDGNPRNKAKAIGKLRYKWMVIVFAHIIRKQQKVKHSLHSLLA